MGMSCRRCGKLLVDETDDYESRTCFDCIDCIEPVPVELIRCPYCNEKFSHTNGWKHCANPRCKIGIKKEIIEVICHP